MSVALWDTSCLDWQDRLLAGTSLVPDLPLFPTETEKALRIFKRLRIPDLHPDPVTGLLPTMGEAAGPWLFPIVAAIFGSYDRTAHRRMIQEYFWFIPKKNAKSSTAAAIMVEALILNDRPEAEFVLVAPTKDLAGISFKQAKGTIKADPELDKLFHIQDHLKTITHRRTGTSLQVKAADTDVITGGKQVGTLIDEVHVLAHKAQAADILVELRGALTARPDGFVIMITTQSKQPPVGVFKAELQKARDVRDGKLQLPLLPILYELPPEIARDNGWRNRKYWPLVNPNLGRSVDEAYLLRELAAAESEGLQKLALFASQHFNVEIGIGLSTDNWPGVEYWPAQADPTLTLKEMIRRCEIIVPGNDGGGLDDLLGLALLGREIGGKRWFLWCHAWAHEIVKERRKAIVPHLEDFERAGELTFVSQMKDAYEQAADLICEIDAAGLLGPTGFDPAGASGVVNALAARGIEGEDRIQGVRQGYSLAGPVKDLETKLADGDLIHAGQGLMAWCVGNAKIEQTKNAYIVTKAASGTAKIDPLMAAFNAAEIMFRRNPEATSSIYSRGHAILIVGGAAQSSPQPAVVKDPRDPRGIMHSF